MILQPGIDYEQLCRNVRYTIPEFFNIGVDVCDQHARGDGRLALIYLDEKLNEHRYSFDDIRRLTNRFANVLIADGLKPGDRVGVFLPQSPEAAIAHVAAMKAGFVSIPLFTQFGDEALRFRLANSEARALVTDLAGAIKLGRIRDSLPALSRVYVIGDDKGSPHNSSFAAEIERASDNFSPVRTRSEAPAIIMYTSGTTGDPKGTLHAHRIIFGHLTGMEFIHDFFPQEGDLHWTPADWAWIAGLFDVLLMSWHYGVPVLAHRAAKFDPELAMRLMADYRVRNVFLPPTALKMMRHAGVRHPAVRLRSILCGGEALDTDLLAWTKETLHAPLHEAYGQTECNLVLGTNTTLFPVRPGSIGRPIPGHDVRIVDESGRELPPGETGLIGVRAPNPVMMLEYWRNPDATARKFAGEFLITGDLATRDEDGYFWYLSRSDDVINSGGYRIGPGEIENCLVRHPAVAMAAVVGVPDPVRTEAVKAWIVLKPGYQESPELARDIQEHVRSRVAAYQYPRHVAFIDSLPMTATGKVKRSDLRARG